MDQYNLFYYTLSESLEFFVCTLLLGKMAAVSVCCLSFCLMEGSELTVEHFLITQLEHCEWAIVKHGMQQVRDPLASTRRICLHHEQHWPHLHVYVPWFLRRAQNAYVYNINPVISSIFYTSFVTYWWLNRSIKQPSVLLQLQWMSSLDVFAQIIQNQCLQLLMKGLHYDQGGDNGVLPWSLWQRCLWKRQLREYGTHYLWCS